MESVGGAGGEGGAKKEEAVHVCPITLDPIVTPACTTAGTVYERAALEDWFSKPGAGPTDPFTGEDLPHFGHSKRVFKVRLPDFCHAVRTGTVSTLLREQLRTQVGKKVEAATFLAELQAAAAPVLGVIRSCLERASQCPGVEAMLQGPLLELVGLVLDMPCAVDNDWLLDWLTSSVGGRRLRATLDATPTGAQAHKVLVMALHHPNDKRFVDYFPSGICYYGSFGDPLSKIHLASLVRRNRTTLADKRRKGAMCSLNF